MKREAYLIEALKSDVIKKKAWFISAFAVISEGPEDYTKDPYDYRIVQTPTGIFFIDPNNQEGNRLTRIDDAVYGEPLFSFKDEVVIGKDICINATGPTETTLGNVLFNLVSLIPSFGSKIPFQTGKVNIGKIEDTIAEKLQDTPLENAQRSDAVIYVDEYVKFVDSLGFIAGLSQLCVWGATEKTMTAPPGVEKLKQELIKKYEGRLHDPVALAEIEKELIAFDAEYLKGDPGGENFATGNKMRNVVRKKLFLMFGAEPGFKEQVSVNPVFKSLEQGWDLEKFPEMINNLRHGSFSRGFQTQLGGEMTKWLLRASANIKITHDDCGTKLGLKRTIDDVSYKKLVGLYVIEGEESLLIDSEVKAKNYIGKKVITRSPMFCKLTKTDYCKKCMGEKLSQSPEGASLAVSEYGSVIMTSFLKAMHSKELAVAKVDFESVMS